MRDSLALQLADGADGLVREQLVAAGMNTRQRRDRASRHPCGRRAVPANVLAKWISPRATSSGMVKDSGDRHVADIGEAFRAQQVLGHQQRREAVVRVSRRAGSSSSPAAPRRRAISEHRGRLRRRPLTGWPGNRGDSVGSASKPPLVVGSRSEWNHCHNRLLRHYHGSSRFLLYHFWLSSVAQFPCLGKALLRPDCLVQLYSNIANIRYPVKEILHARRSAK